MVAEVDDGFCRTSRVLQLLNDHETRAARKGLGRAIRQGYLVERQGPDGLRYVSVSPDGWRAIAAAENAS